MSQGSAGGLRPADEMSAIRQAEKGRRLPVDGLLDIFMKGCAAESRGEHLMTHFALRQLDLEPCEDTLVGNDWFRGVSGGQRKRVSAGARVFCERATNDLIQADCQEESPCSQLKIDPWEVRAPKAPCTLQSCSARLVPRRQQRPGKARLRRCAPPPRCMSFF